MAYKTTDGSFPGLKELKKVILQKAKKLNWVDAVVLNIEELQSEEDYIDLSTK